MDGFHGMHTGVTLGVNGVGSKRFLILLVYSVEKFPKFTKSWVCRSIPECWVSICGLLMGDTKGLLGEIPTVMRCPPAA